MNLVPFNKGNVISNPGDSSTKETCEVDCNKNHECNSFAYCTPDAYRGCYYSDKVLNGLEETEYIEGCTTYFKNQPGKYFLYFIND